jgi:hypothetical protein
MSSHRRCGLEQVAADPGNAVGSETTVVRDRVVER